jgi:hypothetical protein
MRHPIATYLLLTSLMVAPRVFSHPTAVLRGYAAAAALSGPVQLEKGPDYLSLSNPATMHWDIEVGVEGDYTAAIVYSAAGASGEFRLSVGGKKQSIPIAEQRGVFEQSILNFDRSRMPELLHLKPGRQSVELIGTPADHEVHIRSVELALNDKQLELGAKRARANTDWLAESGYGVMFHWTSQSSPRHGDPLPYAVAVERFDVARFVKMVQQTGAAYVIFTVDHRDPHCPAPLKSWEQIHPGWTTQRDLIGEIARALAGVHVRLVLYIASPTLGKMGEADAQEYLDRHKRVLMEMGDRYGALVSGYWLDSWYQGKEKYPTLSLQELLPAVREGNPSRLVAYNSWIYPVEIPWQDYWAGEVGGIVKPSTQRFPTVGPARGLQSQMLLFLDAPWVHSDRDADMEAPRYSDAALIEFVRKSAAAHAAVTLNMGIFQDGTVGEKTMQQIIKLRVAVRGH